MQDTSSKVNGKGITHLNNKGIEVKCGVLEEESIRLNKKVFHVSTPKKTLHHFKMGREC